MAGTLTVYTFEDSDGHEQSFETMDAAEARKHAQENKLLMIGNEYEWQEAVPLEDYRPKKVVDPLPDGTWLRDHNGHRIVSLLQTDETDPEMPHLYLLDIESGEPDERSVWLDAENYPSILADQVNAPKPPSDPVAAIQDAYAKMADPIHVMDHDHSMDH